jgi:hypothetical protein
LFSQERKSYRNMNCYTTYAPTPLQQSILDLLDENVPHKLDWLWLKSGRADGGKAVSGYFKAQCSTLCRMGLARHIAREGYLLVPGKERHE